MWGKGASFWERFQGLWATEVRKDLVQKQKVMTNNCPLTLYQLHPTNKGRGGSFWGFKRKCSSVGIQGLLSEANSHKQLDQGLPGPLETNLLNCLCWTVEWGSQEKAPKSVTERSLWNTSCHLVLFVCWTVSDVPGSQILYCKVPSWASDTFVPIKGPYSKCNDNNVWQCNN